MRRVYYFECMFNTRDARDARDASYICDFLINAACFSGHFSDLVVGGGVSLVVIGRLAPPSPVPLTGHL